MAISEQRSFIGNKTWPCYPSLLVKLMRLQCENLQQRVTFEALCNDSLESIASEACDGIYEDSGVNLLEL